MLSAAINLFTFAPFHPFVSPIHASSLIMGPASLAHRQIIESTSKELLDFSNWLKQAVQTVLVGIVASTIIYGFNIMLGAICIHSTFKTRKRGDSTRRSVLLCCYIIVVLGLATGAVVQTNTALALSAGEIFIFGNHIGQVFALSHNIETLYRFDVAMLVVPPYSVIPRYLPVMIWCADGVLVRNFKTCYII